ncbi:MAG: sulfite exporter TauE/SafE family protein [Cyanobacteria bacterium P01_H01_bin.119]
MMIDFLLVMGLGFLGSFGHCVGMCGPITVALALGHNRDTPGAWRQFWFHTWLNLGRIMSYVLVGATIGALGSVLVAGGQVAGIGSPLRRAIALISGGLLIWMGLSRINPAGLPRLPLMHPLAEANAHLKLNQAMEKLAESDRPWTPLLLGLVWGLIPCGFLYAAQIKAAATGETWAGGLTMLAFGLGTLPTMLGVGVSAAWLGRDRRSQLFQMGGWLTLLMGILMVTRTGQTMSDYTGHLSILCLMLALIARPLSRIWAGLLRCRRALGVGAFIFAIAHTAHMLEHSWGWNLAALNFMVAQHRWGVVAGIASLALMLPLTLTSFNGAQRRLGSAWRRLHLLSVPALLLCNLHCILVGSHYFGRLQLDWGSLGRTVGLCAIVLAVFLLRSPQFWALLTLERYYASPHRSSQRITSTQPSSSAKVP